MPKNACGFKGSTQQLIAGDVGWGFAEDDCFREALHFFGLGAELEQEQIYAGLFEFADTVGNLNKPA